MSPKGKLIVIEGIDGAGGQTQSQLVFDHLKSKKILCEKLTYPDYTTPIGKLIDEYLHGKCELSKDILTLLYTADKLQDKDKINSLLEKGAIIITDRWFTTTLAYQAVQGFPLDKMIRMAGLLDLQKPDLVIYLKISADTSMKRKYGEKGNLDKFENNRKFLEDVVSQYDKLAKENIFGKWVVIDGEKPKEKVFVEIKKALDI